MTSYALNKLLDELAQPCCPDFPKNYRGIFMKLMWLTCAHKIQQCFLAHMPLQLSQVHCHWFYLPDTIAKDVCTAQCEQLLNPQSV
jgi:hypothetical protein